VLVDSLQTLKYPPVTPCTDSERVGDRLNASRVTSEEPAVRVGSACHSLLSETTGDWCYWSLLGIRVICSVATVKANRNLLQSLRTIPYFSPLPGDIFSSSQKRSS